MSLFLLHRRLFPVRSNSNQLDFSSSSLCSCKPSIPREFLGDCLGLVGKNLQLLFWPSPRASPWLLGCSAQLYPPSLQALVLNVWEIYQCLARGWTSLSSAFRDTAFFFHFFLCVLFLPPDLGKLLGLMRAWFSTLEITDARKLMLTRKMDPYGSFQLYVSQRD